MWECDKMGYISTKKIFTLLYLKIKIEYLKNLFFIPS